MILDMASPPWQMTPQMNYTDTDAGTGIDANTDPVYLGIGGNVVLAGFASVVAGCMAGVGRLVAQPGIRLVAVSPWYKTAPVLREAHAQKQAQTQDWYSNAVVHISTTLTPPELLAAIHQTEMHFGRVRSEAEVDAPRGIDIDIIDFGGVVREANPILPHPRMAERGFVLAPLADLAPDWRHPMSGRGVRELLAEVSPQQKFKEEFKQK